MKNILPAFVIVSILFLTLGKADAQGAGIEWQTLNEEAMDLVRQGQYGRAVTVAQAALKVVGQNVGPEHPDVATSLAGLASLYHHQGEYAKAEPLYKRSLAIREKVLGPEHPKVATSLENLAGLYRATKRTTEAERLDARAELIRARNRAK